FPLCDLLILAVAARLLAACPAPAHPATARRALVWPAQTRPTRLLVLGAAGLGTSDLAYALTQLHGGPGAALPVPLGWVLCYAVWGAAALDPAMTGLTVPVPGRAAGESVLRLTLLALAALAVPGALVAVAVQRRPLDTGPAALG